MTKYKIKWRSTITGIIGEGQPVFVSADDAQSWADECNRLYPDLVHWVEGVTLCP